MEYSNAVEKKITYVTPAALPAVPIVQEAGWDIRPAWTGAEDLAPTCRDPEAAQRVMSRYNDCAIPALTHIYIYIYIHKHIHLHIQGVPGGMCQTSGECSLG